MIKYAITLQKITCREICYFAINVDVQVAKNIVALLRAKARFLRRLKKLKWQKISEILWIGCLNKISFLTSHETTEPLDECWVF